ncbi:MAG: sialate O-acetylesterase, partial [Planctomycetota bacterium]
MYRNCATVLVSLLAAVALPVMSASAQKMPRRDVIDVPAIASGLCVSNVFQTNMVLQRDKPIAVWGWATPGERVTVSLGGSEQTANAGKDRTWKVVLPAMPANAKPQRMTVAGSIALHVLENILIGDVWVLGGQSNMEFELAKVENGALEIVSANFPQIRILTVPFAEGPELCSGFARLHEWSSWFNRHFRKGDWDVCTPNVARELSAIGYAFARRVHMASRVPIGVVDASRGGSAVETWVPTARLHAMNDEHVRNKLADWQQRVDDWDSAKDLEQRVKRNREWVARQTKAGKPVPENRLQDPTDLLPGPIAD